MHYDVILQFWFSTESKLMAAEPAIIQKIVLIDDDWDCLFLQKRTILRSGLVSEVAVAKSGEEALDLIRNSESLPEIVFLDINMPSMDGWEFLDELMSEKDEADFAMNLYILSSSLNPDDHKKAESYSVVKGFIPKYLTEEHLQEVINETAL